MKGLLRSLLFKLLVFSLVRARDNQGYRNLFFKLKKIVPNLKDQYTSFIVEGEYLETKVYIQHAFQVSLLIDAINGLTTKKQNTVLVDIGDSSGTHIIYLKDLVGDLDAISVNLDADAVKRIKSKGLKAIECSAENINEHPDFKNKVDIFSSLEMLEHLENPIGFLKDMAKKAECKKFVITVPLLLRKSRIGLHQIRNWGNNQVFNSETTHFFELCPDDWDLLFKFTGWKITKRVKYTQYPKKSLLFLFKYLWRKLDFDGFYGVILEKDDTYSSNYKSL